MMEPEITVKLSQRDIDYINKGHVLMLVHNLATLYISKE